MNTLALNRAFTGTPAVFGDIFRPWTGFFDDDNINTWSSSINIPSVNIVETEKDYQLSMAVPGLKKDDFKIDLEGNLLTISSEKEESREEKDKKFTRKEYNYTSFSRSFTLPDEVNQEKIEAKYEDGVLKIVLPYKEGAKLLTAKNIAVK
jgi:HSP20 family protein